MAYIVIGKNGVEYGPVELETLSSWAREGRVLPRAKIRITPSGEVVDAYTISELGLTNAPPKSNPPAPTAYPREEPPQPDSLWGVWKIIFWSVLSIIASILTKTTGLYIACWGIYSVYVAYQKKDKYWPTIGIIAGITLIIALVMVGIRFYAKSKGLTPTGLN